MEGFLIVAGIIIVVFYFLGVWEWLAMASSFVAQQRKERRELTVLRWKLGFLKSVVREMGRAERRLDELRRKRRW